MPRNRLLTHWLPLLFWSLLIFFFSSLTTTPGPEEVFWDFVLKKSAHIFEFAVLYLLAYRAFNRQSHNYWLAPIIFALFYAASDELHQRFVPGRNSRFADIGFDSLGILLGFLKSQRSL